MMTKTKKTATTETYPRKAIPLILVEGDSEEVAARKFAALVTSPELAAYRVIGAAEGTNALVAKLDVPALLEQLREQSAAVHCGEMAQAEAMLANQATALQALFARLSERAMEQSHMPNFESFMRLALKAQGQCRATLETLATMKNPPLVYARQANIANGPQQINNGTAAPPRAREIETEQTQLSGENHELLQDTRASGNASRLDPALETLGEIDRAVDRRG